MEFGCRYIYIDESKSDVHQNHQSSERASQFQNDLDACCSEFYDNVTFKEISTCSEIDGHPKGLPETRWSPHLVFPDIQPGSLNPAEQLKKPPIIPNRKTKPSLYPQPDHENQMCNSLIYEDADNGEPYEHLKGLPDTGWSSHSVVYPDPQSGSVNPAEQLNKPPLIPDRKTKPSLYRQPDIIDHKNQTCNSLIYEDVDNSEPYELPQDTADNRLSPETNVNQGLQLPPTPKPECKTPPPIPKRKKKLPFIFTEAATSSSLNMNPVSKACENVEAVTPSNMKHQSPPPIPARAYIPDNNTSADYAYAYAEAPKPVLNLNVSNKPSDSSLYLDVLPAHSVELELQKTPPRTPNCSLAPSPVFNKPSDSSLYLDVLPTLSVGLEMQKTHPRIPNRSLAPSPAPPTEQRLPANCNILLLNIGKMVEYPDNENMGFPLLCRGCSAAFSEFSHVDENKTWTCDFCSTENVISEHIDCTGSDQLYLQGTQPGNVYVDEEDTLLIFCIDISGSMSVTIEVPQDHNNTCINKIYESRIEAVKSGLSETLDLLHRQHPRKRVALVTFSDQVRIYGDGTLEPQVLEDCELLDPDYLKSQGMNQPLPRTLEETLHVLKAKVECLKENGATALGPAALVSIAMASKKPGSKVIICTDGRANTDLGNLENITEEYVYQSSKLYYSNLRDLALQHSVVISVVTIEGTDCRLPELGQLADKTGGKVNIVHPLNLAKEFQAIIDEQINATNVEVKVYLPHSMHFLYEGYMESVLKRTLGCTNYGTVLSTEFAIPPSKTKEVLQHSQLPVQMQLKFTLPDGRNRHRIISEKRPVTNDSIAALEAIDLNVLQTHSVQFCAHLAMEGQVNEATSVALQLKELIDQVMRYEKYEDQGVVYEDWENSMAPIYEDLQVYVQKKSSEENKDTTPKGPALKSFSDEMAKMIFNMKRTNSRVLSKWKHQAK